MMMIRTTMSQLTSSSASLPTVLFGFKHYVEYQRGNSNLILSCPHDGDLEPDHIPDRVDGYVVEEEGHFSHHKYKHGISVLDSFNSSVRWCKEMFTRVLTVDLACELESLMGKRPHVVICHLHRNKLDTNRSVNEATFGVPDAVQAYNDFHSFISMAKRHISGPGLCIDIHGHKHLEGWIELGYLIPKPVLNSGKLNVNESSVVALAGRKLCPASQLTFKDLISGEASLGALLQREGYRTVPSPSFPEPGSGKYFRGGYTTRTHGSLYGGLVDAIQIETPVCLLTGQERSTYTRALAQSIKTFMEMHY